MLRISIIAAILWIALSGRCATINQRDVTVVAPEAILAGTLTLPADEVPQAALVLATGSGAQDRDETVLGHKPFKAIAEALADRGYAVLRMDDRGVGQSTGSREGLTTTDNISDVRAGLCWLDSAFTGVPCGVLGHSEGGQIALRLADDPKCRFIITLAAPAWRGDSLVMAQCRAMSVATTGRWDEESVERRMLDIAASPLPKLTAIPMLTAVFTEYFGDQAAFPQVQKTIATQVESMLSPWYRAFLRYDPADAIRSVVVPWLALNGDKDLQVPVTSLRTISELNPSVKTVVMPGHNHLFQHAVTGLPAEYASLPEDISDETLAVIADWLDSLRDKKSPSQGAL